jgi:excisionase family DNA binding protein
MINTEQMNGVHQITDFESLPFMLRVKDLEPLLGISHNTAYALVRSGQIHSIRIGRSYRIPKEAICAYVRSAP